jgi:hypothetical protein
MLARLTQALTRARGSARCVAVSLLVFPQKSNDLVKSLKELVVRKICWDLGRRMKDSDPGPVKCPVGLRKRVFDVGWILREGACCKPWAHPFKLADCGWGKVRFYKLPNLRSLNGLGLNHFLTYRMRPRQDHYGSNQAQTPSDK